MAYRAYIDSRLTDSELKPADVASHFGVSERYVRAVLRANDESFSAYLLRRRLMRCAQRLSDRDGQRSTITEIAFESGFSNATHFGQAFKLHYGVTPREYRRAALQS
jgi:AraC-like DNA-binding protein